MGRVFPPGRSNSTIVWESFSVTIESEIDIAPPPPSPPANSNQLSRITAAVLLIYPSCQLHILSLLIACKKPTRNNCRLSRGFKVDVGSYIACASVCVFIELYITAQFGPVIVVIVLYHSHFGPPNGESMILVTKTSINDQTRQRGHSLSSVLICALSAIAFPSMFPF